MSLADTEIAGRLSEEHLRESWRRVMSVKRSTQQFRARLVRTLPMIEQEVELDQQFADVSATMATVIRILDWTLHDLDRLQLPDKLFEAIAQPAVRILPRRRAT
jgi:hypothetical protein